jgi:hypothetical protein
MANRNYAARYRQAFRADVKPLEVVQPRLRLLERGAIFIGIRRPFFSSR